MAVNKEIGAEAQAYFHQHNRFVRVRFRIPGFKPLYHLIGLPIIANVTNLRMESHCLSLEVDWPTTSTYGAKQTGKPPFPGDDSGIIIISLANLPHLCDALGFLGVMELPSVPLVASAKGERLAVFCPGSDQTQSGESSNCLQIKIAAHANSSSPGLSSNDQKFVLACLKELRPTGFDLSIAGIDHDSARHDLKTFSSIVFPDAFAIDFVHVQRRAKARIDFSLSADRTFNACCQYTLLHNWCAHAWVNLMKALEAMSNVGHPALAECFIAMHVCAIERLCSSIALAIFGGAVDLAEDQFEELELYKFCMTPRMLSWYEHLSILLEVKAYDEEPISDVHGDMMIIIDKLENLSVTDQWIEHDIEVLREYFAEPGGSREMQEGTHASLSNEAQSSHNIGEPEAANTDGQNGELADEDKECSDRLDFSEIEERPESDDEVSRIVMFLDMSRGTDGLATDRDTRHDRRRERAQHLHHAIARLRLCRRSGPPPHPSAERPHRMGRSRSPR